MSLVARGARLAAHAARSAYWLAQLKPKSLESSLPSSGVLRSGLPQSAENLASFLEIDGAPADLVSGVITSGDDEGFEPEPFFTNSAGRFGIIGLAPGRSYTVRLNGSGLSFTVEIPRDNTGLYRMGTIDVRPESP